MPYSLWRNDELLAELVVLFPVTKPGMVSGMLRIQPAFTDIRALMQSRARIFPGAPVFIRDTSDNTRAESGPVEIPMLSAEEARGVPSAQQFEVRDAHGVVTPFDMIWIQSMDIPADAVGELPDLCHAAGLSGKCWCIIAAHPHTLSSSEV